jgi:hypothetical protein
MTGNGGAAWWHGARAAHLGAVRELHSDFGRRGRAEGAVRPPAEAEGGARPAEDPDQASVRTARQALASASALAPAPASASAAAPASAAAAAPASASAAASASASAASLHTRT